MPALLQCSGILTVPMSQLLWHATRSFFVNSVLNVLFLIQGDDRVKQRISHMKLNITLTNCLTQHFSICTEVTELNVRYLRHVYNTSVMGMFRWNFTIRIFCGYAYFHMNHLEGQSRYWEANSQLVVKYISCRLWNLNVHYHNYKSQTMYPIWSLTNAIHIFIYDFFQISFNTLSYQCLSLAIGVFPEGFPEELH